jgi:hypothetical protein
LASKDEVQSFLSDFHTKRKFYGIYFNDNRRKNTIALLELEITYLRRLEIESLCVEDFTEGPLDDALHGIAAMWVFGKRYREVELYIKISLGPFNENVVCISFHKAEYPQKYPFK